VFFVFQFLVPSLLAIRRSVGRSNLYEIEQFLFIFILGLNLLPKSIYFLYQSGESGGGVLLSGLSNEGVVALMNLKEQCSLVYH
jgi:hypothetical protein